MPITQIVFIPGREKGTFELHSFPLQSFFFIFHSYGASEFSFWEDTLFQIVGTSKLIIFLYWWRKMRQKFTIKSMGMWWTVDASHSFHTASLRQTAQNVEAYQNCWWFFSVYQSVGFYSMLVFQRREYKSCHCYIFSFIIIWFCSVFQRLIFHTCHCFVEISHFLSVSVLYSMHKIQEILFSVSFSSLYLVSFQALLIFLCRVVCTFVLLYTHFISLFLIQCTRQVSLRMMKYYPAIHSPWSTRPKEIILNIFYCYFDKENGNK